MNLVKSALKKDGWIITDDRLRIRCGGIKIQIDLGVEKLIPAQKYLEKITNEIIFASHG
ncbi:element excision factor XisH family protein [Merismopedia glauca]|uniref:XisH protein n=1 Tax=Merismopedia glauca CCAP 1448/3 TaxID=1296344 RepID=A0A2T1C4S6_9CYAN|nr:hypothetical protein C7B64_09430 [Merismopedia glauca CCAP 1448/3]